MKKAVSIILTLLIALSCLSVAAFAEDGTQPAVTIYYVVDDVVVSTVYAQPGTVLTQHTPENPVKQDTETTRYTFKGWRSSLDGQLYYKSTQLVVPEVAEGESLEITMTAEFSEKDISGRQSFFQFIASIFERINLIFEYFATIFG
ncbi:MAG: hypothetical protein ACI4GC_02965 [Acutalibacteraceae bacterium]